MKSILCDAQLLTVDTLSAKCPTLKLIQAFVLDGLISLTELKSGKLEKALICAIMKLLLWLLQTAAEMVRNLVMAYRLLRISRSWLGTFRMVGVVSHEMFAMVVPCKEENGRETVVDQRNVDIRKAVDAVVQTEYVCEELSTKIQSVSLLKFRERAVFPTCKCETSEGMCAKDSDFKLMSSINYNNYLEGTRCFANEIRFVRSRYCIFVCSG